MKIAVGIGLVAAAVLGLVVATVVIASRVREETVVANPYEEGLKLGRREHGHEGGTAASNPTARNLPPSPPRDIEGGRGVPGGGAPCDVGASSCTAPLDGGGELRLELSPRPLRTMQELAVRVELAPPPRDAVAVRVSFTMRGMDMGENRSALASAGAGRFEGKAVLVRCPSGRRGWQADVEIAAPGAPARVARFPLTVAEGR